MNPVYIFSTFIWFLIPISFYYTQRLSWKVVSNITSALHATSVVMFYLFNVDPLVLYYSSCGYYIYDGILNLYYFTKSKNSGYLFMIAHHAATVLTMTYLFTPVCTEMIYKNFFLLEFSNYPLYIVYHLKSIKYQNQYIVGFFILMEAVASIVCRFIFGTKDLYYIFFMKDFPWVPLIMGILLYIISAIWLKAVFKQLYQIFFTKYK